MTALWFVLLGIFIGYPLGMVTLAMLMMAGVRDEYPRIIHAPFDWERDA